MPPRLTLRLTDLYSTLRSHYGPQKWWPAQSPFEVILGAILTQNTNWKNVEKAIANLKRNRLLSIRALHGLSTKKLTVLIRPSGYFNIKADRIQCFLDFLFSEYRGSLAVLFREETERLRERLLKVKGIGPETADSILLYAAGRPVFVVDAYTRRVFSRHGLCQEGVSYDQLQALFMNHLEADAPMFNEYHALIVCVGKEFCTPTPRCEACPLVDN
jgi:endonuclease-3 related protein